MSDSIRAGALLALGLVLSGCTSLPADRGWSETAGLIEARSGVAPPPISRSGAPVRPDPEQPMSAEAAIRLALFQSPRLREQYARIGIARADLEDARRLANPTFGFQRLTPGDGGGAQITRSLAASLTDLLLLPSRKRIAGAEFERMQNAVAAAVLKLATEVESSWLEAVGAEQVASMRDLVARSAEQSAELAQRFFDAGNINRLQLAQEQAAATQAQIDATSARAAALRARHALAALIGLSTADRWRIESRLPAPREPDFRVDDLVELALDQRLDLVAARQAVALREDALGVTRRWRWLGDVEIDYEHEREGDGAVMRGPGLSLELPIFNQGQGALARAQAELLQARSELDAQLLAVENDARLGIDALQVAYTIAERYRSELLPQREAIVARTGEEVNFMLVGVFELLRARQEEFDAYQAYLEAVRDYWLARSALRGAVGGRLPDDGNATEASIGVEAILPATDAGDSPDHGHHGHHGHHGASDVDSTDPHAGHRMPEAPTQDDRPAATDADSDPHAQHRRVEERAGESGQHSRHEHHEPHHGDQP